MFIRYECKFLALKMLLAMFLFCKLFAVDIQLIALKNLCNSIGLDGSCTIYRFDIYDGIKKIVIEEPIIINENNILVDEENIFAYKGIQKIFIKKDCILSSQPLLDNKPIDRDIFQQMLFAERLNVNLLRFDTLSEIFEYNVKHGTCPLPNSLLEIRRAIMKYSHDFTFLENDKSVFLNLVRGFLNYVLKYAYGMTKDSKLMKEVFELTNENFYNLNEEIIQLINFGAPDDFILGPEKYQVLKEIAKIY